MRCIALAEELRRIPDSKVIFLVRNDDLAGVNKVKEFDFEVLEIDKNINNELEFVTDFIKNQKEEKKLIIVDSYEIDNSYLSQLGRVTLVMAIDDINEHPFDVDILLNQNLFGDKLDYQTRANTIKLLGGNYILLRDEFIEIAQSKKRDPDRCKSILITMGGSDAANQASRILRVLTSSSHSEIKELILNVVIGPSFSSDNIAGIKKTAFDNPRIVIHENVSRMSELMAVCDIAISACGSSCYELMALGIPSLTIMTGDDELIIFEALKEKECAIALGEYSCISDSDIEENLLFLIRNVQKRRELANNGRRLINVNGKRNVAGKLLELLNRSVKGW